ncbi:MAG: hypothetical protein JXA21_29270 [Anaerolineae bacterium]|nr:hypothetical protein [Anaerolineae bacterium]
MSKWQHCRLQKNRVNFLGAAGVFENKKDLYVSEQAAFSHLEDEGWELVTVLTDPDGDYVYFFKRPLAGNKGGSDPAMKL